ncbi:MAG: protein kinase [Chloroflexota bacterium]
MPPVSSYSGQALPVLNNLPYQSKYFLDTDSKMSQILLVTDRDGRELILKIAKVEQRTRADANRQAIRTEAEWLQRFRDIPGIIQIEPIPRPTHSGQGHGSNQKGQGAPAFVDTLDELEGSPEFIILEYFPGGALSTFVGRNRLDIAVAIRMAHFIACNLAHLHDAGCVHRDIKPENILFATGPGPYEKAERLIPTLIDFGIAAPSGEEKLVSGSRLWMSPELQEAYERSALPIDPAWDIYALGLILCYMITGLRPRRRHYEYAAYLEYSQHALAVLEQESRESIASGAAESGPLVQPSVPPVVQAIERIQRLIKLTLAREPHGRPTAGQFAEETAQILAILGVQLAPQTVRTRPVTNGQLSRSQFFSRHWILAAVIVLLVFLTMVYFRDPLEIGEPIPTPIGKKPVDEEPIEAKPNGSNMTPTVDVVTNVPEPTQIPILNGADGNPAPTLVPPPMTRLSSPEQATVAPAPTLVPLEEVRNPASNE